MKRLITVLILSVAILAVSAFGVICTKHYSETLSMELDKAVAFADSEDFENALKRIEALEQKWDSAETLLCFYKGHAVLEEISAKIEYVFQLAKRKDPSFSVEAVLCRTMICQLYHDERLSHQLLF